MYLQRYRGELAWQILLEEKDFVNKQGKQLEGNTVAKI
jgi:hypothetical protein